jgi:hypothetical protein
VVEVGDGPGWVVVGPGAGPGVGGGFGDGAGEAGWCGGPGWQPPRTVTKGLMVVRLPAASSWKAAPPFWTRIRVPDRRLFIENWAPESWDSTKSMISGARCSLPVERPTAAPVWPLNTVQKNRVGSGSSSATWSKLTRPWGDDPPPSTIRFSNDSGRIGLGLALVLIPALPLP